MRNHQCLRHDKDVSAAVPPHPPLVDKSTRLSGRYSLEAVEWCGEALTLREATRLRRLAREERTDECDGQSAADMTPTTVLRGEAVAGSPVDDADRS